MAEPKTDENFSIEEILESIRQIISEDGDTPVAANAPDSAPAPEQAPAPAAVPDAAPVPETVLTAPEEDAAPSGFAATLQAVDNAIAAEEVFDLTEKVEDADTAPPQTATEPAPQIDLQEVAEMTEPVDTVPAGSDTLLSEEASTAATAALSKLLAGNVAVQRDDASRVGSVTLEDIAREQMTPLIKSWLDQNLPRIIEGIVAKELEKIARRARDE